MRYHWIINEGTGDGFFDRRDRDLFLDLPAFGLICGNWTRAEQTPEFYEAAAGKGILHRVGVSNISE